MNQEQWSQWLQSSLCDGRLDDFERRELHARLTESSLSREERSALRNMSFRIAHKALESGEDASQTLRWLERVVKTLDNSQNRDTAGSEIAGSWFSPGRSCVNGIVEQLRQARHSVDICVFTIADDTLSKQVLAAHKRGVKVRVITDNDKSLDRGSDIDWLAEKGVEVKVDTTLHHMHHKFAIFDNKRLINGSFNWTRSATQHNQEDITLTGDPRFVREFGARFESLWQQFPCHEPVS